MTAHRRHEGCGAGPVPAPDRAALECDGYKLRILGEVRDRRQVNLDAMAGTVRGEEDREFDRLEFYRAASRIKSLCMAHADAA